MSSGARYVAASSALGADAQQGGGRTRSLTADSAACALSFQRENRRFVRVGTVQRPARCEHLNVLMMMMCCRVASCGPGG